MKRRMAVAGAVALALSIFTAPAALAASPYCDVDGDTLVIEEDGDYVLTLWMDGDYIYAEHETGGACDAVVSDDATTLSDVDITNVDDVVFLLEDGGDGSDDNLGDWAGLNISVATEGDVVFDASGLTDSPGADVSVGSGGDFEIEGGDGDIDGADVVEFVGSDESDSFSARSYSGDVAAYGGDGSDDLVGGSGDDSLDCEGDGNDECWGGDGDDSIDVDEGDTVAPGDDDDDIDAGSADGDWTLSFADSSRPVVYDMREGEVKSSAGDDDISGDAPGLVIGSSYGDEIYGSVGSDNIQGGSGADLIRGREGADRISGGDGADRLYGGKNGDTISGGDGADELYGRAGNDVLRGDAGIDTVSGGEDRDTCVGETKDTCEV